MIAVKEGVQPHLIRLVVAVANAGDTLGYDLTITAGIDGEHAPKSLHYALRAIDVRTRNLTQVQVDKLMIELKVKLGPDYDVVLEDDHLHLEFDPK